MSDLAHTLPPDDDSDSLIVVPRKPSPVMAPEVSPGLPPTVHNPGTLKQLPAYAQDPHRPYVGDPWEIQPHEGAKAFSAFVIYRDMDPNERTIRAVQTVYNERNNLSAKSWGVCSKWANKHRWEERAQAHDAYLDAKMRRRLERRKLNAAARHADQSEAALEVLSAPSQELARRMREQAEQSTDGTADLIRGMSDSDLLKLSKAFSGDLAPLQKAERDALGSVVGTNTEPAKVKAAGSILRRVLADKGMLEITERMALEISAEGAADNDD